MVEQVKPRFWEAHGQLTMSPCPACGAEYQHANRNDPRGACNVLQHVWYCWVCKAVGPIADLEVELTKEQRILASAARQLMPREKAERFWNFCVGISPGSDVKTYLDERFGRSDYEVPQGLARRLPDFALETDAIKGWPRARMRLLVPLRDENLEIRNVVARSLAKKPKIKSMSFRGYARKGLMMANVRDMRDGARAVFAEGELDFLAWSLFGPKDVSVFGVQSGSPRNSIVQALRHWEVLLATDLDEAGEQYARQIRRALHESNRVSRWDPGMKKVEDACDVLKKGGELTWESDKK